MNKYETQALSDIQSWRNPERGWFGRALQVVNAPLDAAGDAILKTPGVGDERWNRKFGQVGKWNGRGLSWS
ncbi:hypothetical protein [Paraburkholderia diazotrophica]|uniref:hypothetical protein n=1 Tax=Paraburkholderia diazotrophica TaxID=667676 RepID=UPI00115FE6C1|nr:hypothetical protein [Paraburkholderia diazotrophica]